MSLGTGTIVIDIASGVAVGVGDSEHAVTRIIATTATSETRINEVITFPKPSDAIQYMAIPHSHSRAQDVSRKALGSYSLRGSTVIFRLSPMPVLSVATLEFSARAMCITRRSLGAIGSRVMGRPVDATRSATLDARVLKEL